MDETPKQTNSRTSAEAQTKVLIVEDDPFLRGLLMKKLVQKGYDVKEAENVDQARDHVASEGIKLICLDLMLPGVDGFTYLQELKADTATKDIPVFILSNLGQRDDLDRAKELGAADYAVKANTSPIEIVNKAEKLLSA